MSVSRSRAVARVATAAASAAAVVALTATSALAHVEVESDDARALATNVTVAFTGEAESGTAGLTKVQVVLPEGIAPGDVALAGAPAGWTFTATGDGYTVGGPALAVGQDVVHKITIRQLPNTDEVVFKTLETYGDGHIDRWIELPQNGVEPAHPAPVLRLAPASPGATSLPPSTASPSTGPTDTAAAGTAAPSVSPAAAGDGGGSSPALPLAVGIVVLAAAAAGGWWWRRGRGRDSAG
ncbi:DUF1775 domain-containing protein [Kitasatospora purpeofusca]|uniref:DUF1775 domain-containing protein n=1 Tax=Kitasatospora purpeofusca TaxID=67352 RepID=UPI0036D22ECF